MSIIEADKPNDLSKLHDEILAALPALRPDKKGPRLRVEGTAARVRLEVREDVKDVDAAALTAIIAAHDPTPRPLPPTALKAALADAVDRVGALPASPQKAALASVLRVQRLLLRELLRLRRLEFHDWQPDEIDAA